MEVRARGKPELMEEGFPSGGNGCIAVGNIATLRWSSRTQTWECLIWVLNSHGRVGAMNLGIKPRGQWGAGRGAVGCAYRSTLIAQRLKMEAVHSITSMVIRASHSTVLKDHTPPWN